MKLDLFLLIGKGLDYRESLDNEIEIEINKDWFKRKGFEEFKIKFVESEVSE